MLLEQFEAQLKIIDLPQVLLAEVTAKVHQIKDRLALILHQIAGLHIIEAPLAIAVVDPFDHHHHHQQDRHHQDPPHQEVILEEINKFNI